MKKSSLGFLLGFFFGIFGLLGLLSCADANEKDEFMSGWWKSFIIQIIIIVVICLITSCAICSLADYY